MHKSTQYGCSPEKLSIYAHSKDSGVLHYIGYGAIDVKVFAFILRI